MKIGEDTSQIINDKVENKKLKDKKEVEVKKIEVNLDSKMETIGNLVHDSVIVSDDKACEFC